MSHLRIIFIVAAVIIAAGLTIWFAGGVIEMGSIGALFVALAAWLALRLRSGR